jgi:hypothetical protein
MRSSKMRASVCATFMALLLTATFMSTSVSPQPNDSDNLDGTRTVSWDFSSPGDYRVENTTIGTDGASLSTYESNWLRDTYPDFAQGSQINKVNISGSGDLSLEISAPVELVTNGYFTNPDDGDSYNYPPWNFENPGNSTWNVSSRSITSGYFDNGYCWWNRFVDMSSLAGYSLSIWLNQTINVTSMPLAINMSAFHRYENNSHPATPGMNASIILTNLSSGISSLIASTGWYNSTDSNYERLSSLNKTTFTGLGLYNISLLSRFNTMGNWTEVNHLGTLGLSDYWDNASVSLTAYNPAGTYVSEVFNAGSYAMWKNISWNQIKPAGTNIDVYVRTGNSTVPTDSIWSNWTQALTNSTGSAINRPWGQYLQYRVELSTSNTSISPILRNLNISYEKYWLGGIIETGDYKPANLVNWGLFSHQERANGQTIKYQYSTDSGFQWHDMPVDQDLRDVDIGTISGIRLRAILNTTDTVVSPFVQLMGLSYVSNAPSFTLEPIWDSNGASPGDEIRINVYFNNTAASLSSTAWLNIYLDDNLEYISNNSDTLAVFSNYITDSSPGIKKYVFTSIPISQNMVWIDARVKSGVVDGNILQTTVTLDYMDPLGNRVESILSLAPLRVNGPFMNADLAILNGTADIGEPVQCMLYLNNTGQGSATKIWVNGSLDNRLETPTSSWILNNISGNSGVIIHFNTTLSENAVQGSQVPMSFSVAYSDSSGHVSEAESGSAIIDAALRSRFTIVITSQSETVNSSEMVVLTVHFNNTGFGSAETVKFNMTLPIGLEFVSSSEECLLYGTRCFWELQDVGPGSHSFTVTLRAEKLDESISNVLVVAYMQVIDPVDGQRHTAVSNYLPVSVARIYTFQEKIYWPWSGLAIAIGTLLTVFSLWHFFKPTPPSIDNAFVLYKDGRLISHRKSGKSQKSELDGDLVGAMLTAVQQFITDSLSDDKSDRVKKLEFGERELYLDRGAHTNIAVIYSGSMNRKLKAQIEELIAKIEAEHPFLASWDGRMTQLADVNVQLDELIKSWQTIKTA